MFATAEAGVEVVVAVVVVVVAGAAGVGSSLVLTPGGMFSFVMFVMSLSAIFHAIADEKRFASGCFVVGNGTELGERLRERRRLICKEKEVQSAGMYSYLYSQLRHNFLPYRAATNLP